MLMGVCLIEPSAGADGRRQRTTILPLMKRGPFTIDKLFDIVLKKYFSYMEKLLDKRKVRLPSFQFHFASNITPIFNTPMIFDNGTFSDVARFLYVHNVSVYAVDNDTYVSEAIVLYEPVFIVYTYQFYSPMFYVCALAALKFSDPCVHIVMKYRLGPKNYTVELVKAYFWELRNREDILTNLDQYSNLEREIADQWCAYFMEQHKRLVDDRLFEQFNDAIRLSEIGTVLNLTKPGVGVYHPFVEQLAYERSIPHVFPTFFIK